MPVRRTSAYGDKKHWLSEAMLNFVSYIGLSMRVEYNAPNAVNVFNETFTNVCDVLRS